MLKERYICLRTSQMQTLRCKLLEALEQTDCQLSFCLGSGCEESR